MRAALLALALLLAGCTAPPPPAPPGPGEDLAFAHQHAAFAIFLGGVRVKFDHTDYDLANRSFPQAHLRIADPHGENIVHLEGAFPRGAPNVTLGAFLGSLGVRFVPGALTLDTLGGHNGTRWNDTREARWQVWLQQGDNGTVQPLLNGPAHVLGQDQRVLLSHAPPGRSVFEELDGMPKPPPANAAAS